MWTMWWLWLQLRGIPYVLTGFCVGLGVGLSGLLTVALLRWVDRRAS